MKEFSNELLKIFDSYQLPEGKMRELNTVYKTLFTELNTCLKDRKINSKQAEEYLWDLEIHVDIDPWLIKIAKIHVLAAIELILYPMETNKAIITAIDLIEILVTVNEVDLARKAELN